MKLFALDCNNDSERPLVIRGFRLLYGALITKESLLSGSDVKVRTTSRTQGSTGTAVRGVVLLHNASPRREVSVKAST